MRYETLDDFFADALKKVKTLSEPSLLDEIKNSEDVVEFHHDLGRQVRNYFGLWNVNRHLGHPDIISHKFLEFMQNELIRDTKNTTE